MDVYVSYVAANIPNKLLELLLRNFARNSANKLDKPIKTFIY
jgi:hypothetical protein